MKRVWFEEKLEIRAIDGKVMNCDLPINWISLHAVTENYFHITSFCHFISSTRSVTRNDFHCGWIQIKTRNLPQHQHPARELKQNRLWQRSDENWARSSMNWYFFLFKHFFFWHDPAQSSVACVWLSVDAFHRFPPWDIRGSKLLFNTSRKFVFRLAVDFFRCSLLSLIKLLQTENFSSEKNHSSWVTCRTFN